METHPAGESYPPREIARRVDQPGVAKAHTETRTPLVLATLAGVPARARGHAAAGMAPQPREGLAPQPSPGAQSRAVGPPLPTIRSALQSTSDGVWRRTAGTVAGAAVRRFTVIIVGLSLGALIWAFSERITGTREPFDGSMLYYAVATFAAGAASAFPSPRHWWLALLSVYFGEHLYAFIAYPDTRAWFLFGLFVNALVPTWIFTAAGAWMTFLITRLTRH